MEPMVHVNYCEKSELGNPRCQKLSDLDSKTVEQDKAWYADRDPNTNEPKTTAQMFFTVYYAEKGDKMLHHLYGRSDGYAESCTAVFAELLQSGRKGGEGETRTAGSREK